MSDIERETTQRLDILLRSARRVRVQQQQQLLLLLLLLLFFKGEPAQAFRSQSSVASAGGGGPLLPSRQQLLQVSQYSSPPLSSATFGGPLSPGLSCRIDSRSSRDVLQCGPLLPGLRLNPYARGGGPQLVSLAASTSGAPAAAAADAPLSPENQQTDAKMPPVRSPARLWGLSSRI